MGIAIEKLRKGYRNHFNITDKTKKSKQNWHDRYFFAGFNLGFSPLFYYASGARDWKEMAAGTAIAIGFGLCSGGLMGRAIDWYKDLAGLEESERVPGFIKERSLGIKRTLIAGLTADSITLTAGMYTLSPDKFEYDFLNTFNQEQTTEQTLPETDQNQRIESSLLEEFVSQ